MRKRILATMVIVALQIAPAPAAEPAVGPDVDELLELVREKSIFGQIEPARLREGAARGLVAVADEALGKPPYSERSSAPATGTALLRGEREGHEINCLYTPRDLGLVQQELAGKFGGIGARIAMRQYRREWRDANGRTSVLSTAVELLEALPDSPSMRAGLKKGDRILAVDGQPIGQKSLADLVAMLRGPVGTKVRLAVDRPQAAPFEVAVGRDTVRVPSVTLERVEASTAQLRIDSITHNSGAELAQALTQARSRGVNGLVLDLRGCPGGLLEVAVELASAFLPAGSPVVTLRSAGGAESTLSTSGTPRFDGGLVVLVDRRTASGAEILAAALQSHRRGLVAGETTFGKRTAETIFSLKNGYAAKLSTSFFRRPGAPAGSGFPVVPDVPLSPIHPEGDEGPPEPGSSVSAADPQLRAAQALLGWRSHDGAAVK